MLTRRLGVVFTCAAVAAFGLAFLAGRSSRPQAPPAATGRPLVTLPAPGGRPAVARLRRAPALPKLRLPAPVVAPAGSGAAVATGTGTGTEGSPAASQQPSTGGQPVTPPASNIPSGSATRPQPDPQPQRREPREEPPVIDEDSG